MKRDDLGLPIEYLEYFDIPANAPHVEKNEAIEKTLEKYNAKSVLDMTCGTGSQVLYLTRLGYDLVNSDFSSALLKMARKNANQTISNGLMS